jgi:hypothetical protein
MNSKLFCAPVDSSKATSCVDLPSNFSVSMKRRKLIWLNNCDLLAVPGDSSPMQLYCCSADGTLSLEKSFVPPPDCISFFSTAAARHVLAVHPHAVSLIDLDSDRPCHSLTVCGGSSRVVASCFSPTRQLLAIITAAVQDGSISSSLAFVHCNPQTRTMQLQAGVQAVQGARFAAREVELDAVAAWAPPITVTASPDGR